MESFCKGFRLHTTLQIYLVYLAATEHNQH
jgi:hypothetical protein